MTEAKGRKTKKTGSASKPAAVKRVRSRKGYVMVEMKDEFRERLDWLLADEERKTGTRPEQAPFFRTLVWQEYERRQATKGSKP